jgi:hypothetical protein
MPRVPIAQTPRETPRSGNCLRHQRDPEEKRARRGEHSENDEEKRGGNGGGSDENAVVARRRQFVKEESRDGNRQEYDVKGGAEEADGDSSVEMIHEDHRVSSER